jgi:hypothetical protein
VKTASTWMLLNVVVCPDTVVATVSPLTSECVGKVYGKTNAGVLFGCSNRKIPRPTRMRKRMRMRLRGVLISMTLSRKSSGSSTSVTRRGFPNTTSKPSSCKGRKGRRSWMVSTCFARHRYCLPTGSIPFSSRCDVRLHVSLPANGFGKARPITHEARMVSNE